MENNSTPGIQIPSDLLGEVLFSHPFEYPRSSFLPPSYVLLSKHPFRTCSPRYAFKISENLLQEVSAHVSSAFSPQSQIAGVRAMASLLGRSSGQISGDIKPVPEPIVSLYYPYGGCDDVIDAVVKMIACEQSADVVVIDSLALAMGKFGPYGKEVSDAIFGLYQRPSTEIEGCDSSLAAETNDKCWSQALLAFDALVNISQSVPRSASVSPSSSTLPARRIIYLRDFGSILRFAEPIVVGLLHAIHGRRTTFAGIFDGTKFELEDHIQPTVLVLGVCPLDSGGPPQFLLGQRGPFVSSGLELGKYLDPIGKRVMVSDHSLDRITPFVSHFSNAFFLSYSDMRITHSTDIKTAHGCVPLDSFDLGWSAHYCSVFAQTIGGPTIQKAQDRMRKAREEIIGNAWLKVSLCSQAAVLADESADCSSERASGVPRPPRASKMFGPLSPLPRLERLHVLHDVAKVAVGLEGPSRGQDLDIQISSALLIRAFRLVLSNQKSRSKWLSDTNLDYLGFPVSERPSDSGIDINSSIGRRSSDTDSIESNEDKDSDDDGPMLNEDPGGGYSLSLDPIMKDIKASKALTKTERRLLTCVIGQGELETSFEDVCVSPQVVESLRRIVTLPLTLPQAFSSGILKRESVGGVLLYGPPGTGKTLLCRAVAQGCGARMLYVKPSDVLHKYSGEAEKAVASLFNLARKIAPCLIFMDEMDSIFHQRKDHDTRWEREMLSEFLQAIDGLRSAKANPSKGIVVVGASNRPQDIDPAVLRRLSKRVMMDLPGEEEREKILRLHLREEPLGDALDLRAFAKKLKNYSGSDIKNLCVTAALDSVKEAVGELVWTLPKAKDDKSRAKSKPKSKVKAHVESPTPAEEANGASTSLDVKLKGRKITMAHLTRAMSEVRPSFSADSHFELYEWHRQFQSKELSISSDSDKDLPSYWYS